MIRIAASLLILLSIVPKVYSLESFNITNMTQESDLIVYGKVESVEYVWRDNIPLNVTTDTTVFVENLLKGETNLGEDRIIFMRTGGIAVNPETGKKKSVWVTNTPSLRVDENVLLFLYIHPYPHLRPMAHSGLVLSKQYRRTVKYDDTVAMPYSIKEPTMIDGQMRVIRKDKEVVLPLDLVIQIIKAAIEEPEETLEIEEKFITYAKETSWKDRDKMPSKTILDEVKTEVDEILEREEEDEK